MAAEGSAHRGRRNNLARAGTSTISDNPQQKDSSVHRAPRARGGGLSPQHSPQLGNSAAQHGHIVESAGPAAEGQEAPGDGSQPRTAAQLQPSPGREGEAPRPRNGGSAVAPSWAGGIIPGLDGEAGGRLLAALANTFLPRQDAGSADTLVSVSGAPPGTGPGPSPPSRQHTSGSDTPPLDRQTTSRTWVTGTGTSHHTSRTSQQLELPMGNNPWEWQETYGDKVDVWQVRRGPLLASGLDWRGKGGACVRGQFATSARFLLRRRRVCAQVGCLVHEIMCGCLPFEAEDPLLAAALILWADISVFPDHLSPECVSFIQVSAWRVRRAPAAIRIGGGGGTLHLGAGGWTMHIDRSRTRSSLAVAPLPCAQMCLTKDPSSRPSVEELLSHEWITRHEAGEVLLSIAEIKRRQEETEANARAAGDAARRQAGLLAQAWGNIQAATGWLANSRLAVLRALGLHTGEVVPNDGWRLLGNAQARPQAVYNVLMARPPRGSRVRAISAALGSPAATR